MELKIKAVHPKMGKDFPLPQFATPGSAAMDLLACIDSPVTLAPGARQTVPTGIAIALPSADYVALVFARSGLGIKQGVCLSNGVGVIDSDYFEAKNEGHILIKMTSDDLNGKMLSVQSGDAFAQGIFLPYGITVDDDADGQREGGFGSTTGK